MIISILVAVSQNNVIGFNGQLPWQLPADMKYFRELTIGHHVIMGRKTYDSIKNPLSYRTNIVITRQRDLQLEGVIVSNDLESAFKKCEEGEETECFVIGGADIIKQCLDKADKIYLTTIYHDFEGDTYLPKMDITKWKETKNEYHESDENNQYNYSFKTFVKI